MKSHDGISMMTYETDTFENNLDKLAEKNGMTGEKSVMSGGISNSVREKAAEKKNDLIVGRRYRRSVMGRFLLGSIVNSMLHQANLGILVVSRK
ncbi:universal stress protein [Francisella tularensis]|nr:universal stress protein [Francisella tularensis]